MRAKTARNQFGTEKLFIPFSITQAKNYLIIQSWSGMTINAIYG